MDYQCFANFNKKKGTNYLKNSYDVKMLRGKLHYMKITNIIETKL